MQLLSMIFVAGPNKANKIYIMVQISESVLKMCFHKQNEFFWIPNKVYIRQSCNIHLLIVLQTRIKSGKKVHWNKIPGNIPRTAAKLSFIFASTRREKSKALNLLQPPNESHWQSPCFLHTALCSSNLHRNIPLVIFISALPWLWDCSTAQLKRLSLSVGGSFSKNYGYTFCFKKKDQKNPQPNLSRALNYPQVMFQGDVPPVFSLHQSHSQLQAAVLSSSLTAL